MVSVHHIWRKGTRSCPILKNWVSTSVLLQYMKDNLFAVQLFSLCIEQQKSAWCWWVEGQNGRSPIWFRWYHLVAWSTLTKTARTKEWGESCFGDCRSESVVLIWFCQQRSDSSVYDMYHALLKASWEVPAKCSTWVTNVKDMGPGFCGVLEALYIWASQYSVVVCVCAHTLEKRGGFLFACVCLLALVFV